MDPNSNNTRPAPSGPSMALTILVFVIVLRSASWMIGVVIDGEPLSEGNSSLPFEQLYRIVDTIQGLLGTPCALLGSPLP